MTSERVTLEWYECEQAIYVGARREAEAIRWKIEKPQYSKRPSIVNHIQSSGAEKAVAKLLNINWNASINTFRDGVADVGGRVEVRYRSKDEYDLIVRDEDHDDRVYVLVRGEMPDYEIIGWMFGKEAKQERFRKNPGGHKPCFLVPEKELHPISDLKVSRIRLGDEFDD